MIAIRRARPEDGDAIARVHVESWHRAYDKLVPAAMREHVSLESREQMWQVLLDRYAESHPALVAETGQGEIVGFAMAARSNDGVPGFGGEIHMLFVIPAYQRRDLGRRLFLGLIPVLAGLGVNAAVASVLETSQAVAFFAAMGGELLASNPFDMPGTPLMQHLFGWRDLAGLTHTLSDISPTEQ